MLIPIMLFAVLQWGPYTVSWQKLDPEKLPEENLVLHITKANQPVRALKIWQADAETLDVDNDGISELLITDYSGGAHCCFTYHLYSRNPDVHLLGVFEMGNGGMKFEDLDGDGILEGAGDYDGFAYFDFPFSVSPFIPLVFTLKDGKYVENTVAYPRVVKKALADELATKPDENDPDYQKAYALDIFALALLSGDETSAWNLAREKTPAMISWLTDKESEIKRILEERKNRVKFTE